MSEFVIRSLKFIVDYRRKVIIPGSIKTLLLSLLVLVSDMHSVNLNLKIESRIQNPVKYLRRRFCKNSLRLLFAKASFLNVCQGSEYVPGIGR